MKSLLIFGVVLLVGAVWLTSRDPCADQTRADHSDLIKSVRVDLSAMDPYEGTEADACIILNQIISSGGNTIFLSAWSDGAANYGSQLAEPSRFGKQHFVERVLARAHRRGVTVYAWYVVGEDTFPAQQHPEWFATTTTREPLYQRDGRDRIPFASLYSGAYQAYHDRLLAEAAGLEWDGWVISEPAITWEENLLPLTQTEIQSRAQVVTDHVKRSLETIKKVRSVPVIITLYLEPKADGRLDYEHSLNWLGHDVQALIALGPDGIELQSLYKLFEPQQSPDWTASMVAQFRSDFQTAIPLYVSVQGWEVSAAEFGQSLESAAAQKIVGLSTYAYHTLGRGHWRAFSRI